MGGGGGQKIADKVGGSRGFTLVELLVVIAIIGMLITILLTLSFCALTTEALWAEDAPKTVLRVLCYNIKHGQGMDGKVDLTRTANAIKQWNPDLVAVQEFEKTPIEVEITNKSRLIEVDAGPVVKESRPYMRQPFTSGY